MAKKIKLSATRVSSFLSCKQKYWFSYHERLPKVANPSFKLGTAVHETLEFAGKIWLEKGELTKADKKKALEFYDEVSIKEGIEDLDIHMEGKELVKKRLNKFLTGKKLLGLETKFGFWTDDSIDVTTSAGVPLMGAIDKIEEYNKDTLLIIDYKTSKTAPTPDQLRTDMQLSIYDIVARKLWPQYNNVVLALDLLKSDLVFTYRTEEARQETESYLKKIYDGMLSLKAEEVKASLNMFCPWCDYKDYCDTYQKACKKSDYEFLPTMGYTDEQLVTEWKSVRDTKKILESRERELGMILTEKIKMNSQNIVAGDQQVYIRQNSRVTYDLADVRDVVPSEDFHKVVNVNKKAVETYANTNPKVKERLLETANTSYTAPFLSTKKVNKSKKKK
jgi:putative RecB family exonuclease